MQPTPRPQSDLPTRRAADRQAAKDERRKPQKHRRHQRSYRDHPAWGTAFVLAMGMLAGGQPARMRTIHKVARWILHEKMHQLVPNHLRGSWRSWPRSIGRKAIAKLEAQP